MCGALGWEVLIHVTGFILRAMEGGEQMVGEVNGEGGEGDGGEIAGHWGSGRSGGSLINMVPAEGHASSTV